MQSVLIESLALCKLNHDGICRCYSYAADRYRHDYYNIIYSPCEVFISHISPDCSLTFISLIMTTSAKIRNAHLAMLFANMGWGIMSPVSKSLLLEGSISPLALSGIRISGGALLFFIFSFILPSSFETRQKIDRSDYLKLLICSLLIISANQGLFILGIGLTNPVDSSVMSSLTPVFTMLLAAIFLHIPITAMKIAGVLTGLAGVIVLVTDTAASEMATNPIAGNMLCLGAQICAAIYYVAFEGIIKKYSAYSLMKWLFFISVFTYVPFCLPEIMKIDFQSLTTVVFSELTYIIVVATFIGYLLIPFSQKTLKPTVVSMYSYLQPVFAAVIALVLGVGDFGWIKIGATILIFAGISLVTHTSSRHLSTK